jgi:AraC family transcriptional regulator
MTRQAVQTREETILHHRERLNAVLLYIQENLYAPLTVEALAAVAGFSPFHFHRIFAAYLRETTSDYVRRIRLEWAARRLIFSSDPVTKIALAAGYETPAAFGRAFKKYFQTSPRTFRTQRRPILFENNWEPLHLQPEFRQRPDHELVYIPCVGAEADSEAVWTMLQQHPGLSGGAGVSAFDSQEAPSYVQICRDRPNEGITAREKMRVDAGSLLDEGVSIQPYGRVGVQKLPGGVYAVFHHYGRRREAMWQAIYRRWLPQSELRLRDAPPYTESATLPGLRRGQDQSLAI